MRLFFGIELPCDVVTEMERLQRLLLKLGENNLRIIPVDNLHITLKFLGDTEESFLETLIEASEKKLINFSSYSVMLSEFGMFPEKGTPSIFWVGLKDQEQHTSSIARALDIALGVLGFKAEERPFTPHITIARAYRRNRRLRQSMFEGIRPQCIPFHVKSVVLFNSILRNSGADYQIVKRFLLS